MCTMAFFAFLRIREITVSKRDGVHGNLLQLNQVSKKHSGNGDVVSLTITFTSYKHHYNQNPFSIVYIDNLKHVLFNHSWIMLPFVA